MPFVKDTTTKCLLEPSLSFRQVVNVSQANRLVSIGNSISTITEIVPPVIMKLEMKIVQKMNMIQKMIYTITMNKKMTPDSFYLELQ